MEVYESFNRDDTFDLGFSLAKAAVPREVISLNGDLGAGKTVFTKGFAAGLGIEEELDSPTFSILKSYYTGRLPLHHFDVYRIQSEEELDETGYEDCFYGEGVSLIEWGNLVSRILPLDAVIVNIERDYGKGDDYRRIEVSGPDKLIHEASRN